MSSLIELIEFDSKSNSKASSSSSSSKPINSNGIYSSNEARAFSKNSHTSSIHTPFPFSHPHPHPDPPLIALTPSQDETKPSNNRASQKHKRHIGGATPPTYNNISKTNFNFATSPQRDVDELASPIIWNKLNKALNNTYIIDTNTRDKDANDNNNNVNSNKNSINSINTLNRNVSTTNLNQQTSEKSDVAGAAAAAVDRKSLSYLNANDEMNSITNLNNISNSINTNNTYTSNINQQEPVMFSTPGQRRFCACCCCFNANEKGNISNNNSNKNPLSNSDTFRMLTFHLKRVLSNFKVNMLGLFLSTVISFTFVIMTYTLRNSLNLIELSKAYSQNKVTNETSTFLNRSFTFNIEYKHKRVDSNCDFCFLIVWAATSSLTLIYPVFFLFACRTYKKKTKSTRLIEAASKVSQDNLVAPPNDENGGKPLRRRIRVKSPYLLLLSESLKIFNTKKKRGDANTISNNVSNGTNGKNDVNNFDHLKLKRYLFLKILAVTFLWILTGYTYIRAIHLLYCSEVIILFSVNFAFVFITSWIILHNKFIPIRVRFYTLLQ